MKLATGSDTVDQMQELHFEGNVTPHTWYQNLLLKSGKPDLIAITILGDVAYWYRPTYLYDDATGQLKGIKKKFKADLLQRDYESFEKRFGFSKKQIREAFDRLEKKKVVKRHFRTIVPESGVRLNNVLFIELYVQTLRDITYSIQTETEGKDPIDLQGNSLLPEKETPYLPNGKHPIDPQGNTNTKITYKDLVVDDEEYAHVNGESDGVPTTDPISGDSPETKGEEISQTPEQQIKALEALFIQRRASGFMCSANDINAMRDVVDAGVPLDDALRWTNEVFDNYKPKYARDKINSFSYVATYILARNHEQEERKKALTEERIADDKSTKDKSAEASGRKHGAGFTRSSKESPAAPYSITNGQVGWIGRESD